MRNGNNAPKLTVIGSGYCVLTVPMRNGNVKMKYDISNIDIGSYRTYEEWKRVYDAFYVDIR